MLYHLTTTADWARRDAEFFAPRSLETEGFVHLSGASQVAGTASRFFAGRDDVILLEIDERRLTQELVWEDLYGHGAFPHLYGPIDLAAVVRAEPYSPEKVL